jgi:predicted transcriptional regulator
MEVEKVSKVKISLYLAPAQLRLIDEIAKKFHQGRAIILREAVSCYLSLYSKSKEESRNEVVQDMGR